jgi:hypothetical protein
LAEATPVIMEKVNESIPLVVEKFNELISKESFWNSVALSVGKSLSNPAMWANVIPTLTWSIAINFISHIPMIVSEFAKGIGEAAKHAFDSVTGGGIGGTVSKAGGGILGTVKKVFKFHDGGEVPALVKSGETFIDQTTTQQLKSFLAKQSSGQPLSVIVQVGEKQLAGVLLNISNGGFRTA